VKKGRKKNKKKKMTSASTTKEGVVCKLQGDQNWPVWKNVMRTQLKALDCWMLITGEEARPDEPADADGDQRRRWVRAVKEYDTREAKAMAEINKSVVEGLLYLVASDAVDTPKKQWDSLVSQFEKDTMQNQMQILLRLINLKQAGKKVDEYYREYMDLSARLNALQCEIPEKVKTALFINGLSSEYEIIRATWIAKGEFTVNQFTEALRSEEMRQLASEQSVGGDSALAMRPDPRRCYNCGKQGHISVKCRAGRLPATDRSVRGGDSHGGSESDGEFEGESGADGGYSYGFVAMTQKQKSTFNQPNNVSFLLDSGASAHMVNDKSLFTKYEPLERKKSVVLGNGKSVYASGIGNISVFTHHEGHARKYNLTEVLYVPELKTNLVSVAAVTDKGYRLMFNHYGCRIRKGNQCIGFGRRVGSLYQFQVQRERPPDFRRSPTAAYCKTGGVLKKAP
jgi:hypothetical protein